MKPTRSQYCIKSCPTDDTEQFELLLNSMAEEGWELYSMHEAEGDDDEFKLNCIFVRDYLPEELSRNYADYFGFKTKMERIMSPKTDPIDICLDIQKKIKEIRKKISQIKSLLDSTSEDSRKQLNNEMSVYMNELEKLKQKLFDCLSPDVMYNKIGEVKLSVSLSEELTELVDPDSDINLLTKIVQVRQNLTETLGYVIPEVRPVNGDYLQSNELEIIVRGIPALKTACYPGYVMYFKDELNLSKLPKNAIKDIDPVTGRKIVWLPSEKSGDYWTEGLDAYDFTARLLEYTVIKHVDEIIDYGDMNKYIEIVALKNLFLIENIIPDYVSVGELKYILTSLIKEHVSIKDIMFIFEKINDLSSEPTKEDLLASLRRSLARQITVGRADSDGNVKIIELSPKTLKIFGSDMSHDNVIRIDGDKVTSLVSKILSVCKDSSLNPKDITLVFPSELRLIAFTVLSKFIPDISVVAREELIPEYNIETVALI